MSEKEIEDELFIKGDLKMLVDSPYWNKLVRVLQDHKGFMKWNKTMIDSQENQLSILFSMLKRQQTIIERQQDLLEKRGVKK